MTTFSAPIHPPISGQIWDMKYRLKTPEGAPLDQSVEDTWRRVARALAAAEPEDQRAEWEQRFHAALDGYRFLPAGRILSGAGTGRAVTLFNCFVMGNIPDSMGGIFEMLKEAALTLQQGGGIGFDFSTIRPQGAPVAGVGADASGPLSFMDVWDAMCRTIMSAGARRGAMMATMRCDHPDIEDFIAAKHDAARLRMFNLSVLASDDFMEAIDDDASWELQFEGRVYRTVRARDLWNRIMRATYDYAEPGVIFIDRINRANNLHYAETISATNPCGEQPLPPYGACLLGSINLAALVREPFEAAAAIAETELTDLVAIANPAIDAQAIFRWRMDEGGHGTGGRQKIAVRVFGINADFDGMAVAADLLLGQRQLFTAGDAQLPFDQVQTGNHLGDRVFDLQTGIHFHEKEPAIPIENEFDGAGVLVADRARGGYCGGGHFPAHIAGHRGAGRFFDYFLIAALYRTLAFEQMHDIVMPIRKNLDFDVAGVFQEFLEQHALVAKAAQRLPARGVQRFSKRAFFADDAHAFAAATGTGFDHDRPTDAPGCFLQFLVGL